MEQYFTSNTVPIHSIRIEKGEKWTLIDETGNTYVDLSTSTLNLALGHREPHIQEAVQQQMDKVWFVPTYFQNQAYLELCKLLVSQAPPGICVVNARQCNGADCVDTAIKMALLHTRRSKILCLRGGWHGASLGTLPLASMYNYHRISFLPDVEYSEKPTVSSLLQLVKLSPRAAAVVLDPIGVSNGVFAPSLVKEDMQTLRKLCSENGITLIFDEVQSFGYMGEFLFASAMLDVVPDIICISKALGAGLPLSATLCKDEYRAVLVKKEAEYTCGGQPLPCVAAVQFIKTALSLKDQITKNLASLESLVKTLSLQCSYLTFQQAGFVVGITRRDGMYVKPWILRVYRLALEKGLIIRNNYCNLLIKAPVITPPEVLEEAFTKLYQIFEVCEKELATPSQLYADLIKNGGELTTLTRVKKRPPVSDQWEYVGALLAQISTTLSVKKIDADEQVQLCRRLISHNIPAAEMRDVDGCPEYTYQPGTSMDFFMNDHCNSDPGLINGLVLEHQRYVEMAHDAGISIPDRWPGNAIVSHHSLTLIDFDLTYSDSTESTLTLFAFEEVFSTFQCVSWVRGNSALQQDLADRLCYAVFQRQGQLALTLWEKMIKFYSNPDKLFLPESLSHVDYMSGIDALNKGFKRSV